MSWLCLFTFSCLANPAAPVIMPLTPDLDTTPIAAHVQSAPLRTPRSVSKSGSSEQLVSCELRQAKRGGEHVVVAVIRASTAAEGEYEFSLKARDAHRNTVSASQGDLFRIKGGEQVELDGPSVNFGRSGTLKGRLDLRDAEGRAITSCVL